MDFYRNFDLCAGRNSGAAFGQTILSGLRLYYDQSTGQLAAKGIKLEVTPAAIDAIAEEGYDPVYGARPLKRVIQQRIQNPLAVEILKREFAEGSRVKVDCVDGEFMFNRIE